MRYKQLLRSIRRDIRHPFSALACKCTCISTWKRELMANLLQKIISRSDICHILYYQCRSNIESLKSLHTLFDKFTKHVLMKFEQYHMVHTKQNLVLFVKKMVNHFFWISYCWYPFGDCDWNNCLMLYYKNHHFQC